MEEKYPVRNPDIVARIEEKEALLFNPADGNLVCINKTGIIVWGLCDGRSSVKKIAEAIAEKQEVSLEKAEEDCLKFMEELEKPGFVTRKI